MQLGKTRWLTKVVYGTRILKPNALREAILIKGGPILPIQIAEEGWILCLTGSGLLFLWPATVEDFTNESW